MGNLQDVGQVSDALFAYQMMQHTGTPDADSKARHDWVCDRTHNILCDEDFQSDLMLGVIENHSDANGLLYSIVWATSKDYINQLASLHAAMTREARRIAESEATIRFGF